VCIVHFFFSVTLQLSLFFNRCQSLNSIGNSFPMLIFLPFYIFSSSIYNSISMNILRDHNNFGHQISFLSSVGLFHPFNLQKQIFSFSIHNSHRLMGHMTYFIFDSLVPSPRIQRFPNFFGLRTLSIKLQTFLCFFIFEIRLLF
jgi:hypothetical protein